MAFTLGKISARKILTGALGLGAALLLASCGGGGGSGGTPNGQTSTPTYALSLVAPTSSSVSLAAYGSQAVTVLIKPNSGTTLPSGTSVGFASLCITSGKATVTQTANTTTDEVSFVYTDNGCGSTDEVSISTSGATTTPITLTFVDAAPTPASISFVSATPASESIVIAGAGGSGRVESASLLFQVLDTHGNPLPNQAVNFSLVPAGVVTLQTTAASTNSTGEVTAIVSSGSQATTFRVVATLPTGQSTMSDTIAVTTGQVSPASMSVSVTTFNIEGWNFDNITSSVNVLLADSNGNPVADGTPVVAQTDSGAIGTSSIGGCVTTDGACTMTFRSQNPRYGAGNLAVPSGKRAGLATITVSTTTANQSTPIYGYAGIFLSGSDLATVIPSVDPSSGATILAPTASVPGYTIKMANCFPVTAAVQLNDVNNNPLPAKTGLVARTASMGVNSSGAPNPAMTLSSAIAPVSVPNQGVDTLTVSAQATFQGSYHSVGFAPIALANVPLTTPATSGCSTSGTYPTTSTGAMSPNGMIVIQATSPQSVVSSVPVYVWYPQSP